MLSGKRKLPGTTNATADAVVTVVQLDSAQVDTSSLESVYMIFCHQIHFFSSRTEAEEWTSERDYDFAILSLDEAFELGQLAFKDMLAYA